jgi:D-alanyl-D-alanine carboxypeptidase
MALPRLNLSRRSALAGGAAALLAGLGGRLAHADPFPLAGELDSLRLRYGLPGVAALVLRGGAVVAQGVAGVRVVTSAAPVQPDDPFVIGSCGKSMTATVAARLAARGAAPLETTLARAFPELVPWMQPAYRAVTLEALLAHRGGFPQVPPIPLPLLRGDPASQRARALPVLLALPPQGLPDQTFLYSNIGYIVAGALLERLAGVPFEQLAFLELFQPLGLLTAGFGPPLGDASWGHTAGWTPVPPDSDLQPPPGASPAGLVHLSLADWARYIAVHMGLGPAGYLTPEWLARLQRSWSPDLGAGYALGWHVEAGTWGTELRHNGSDGYWAARVRVLPGLGWATLTATNMLGVNVEPAGDELEASLLRLFPPA